MTGSGAVLLLAAPTSYRLAAFERAARRLHLPIVRGIDVPGDRVERGDGVLAVPFAKSDLAVVELSAGIWSGEFSAVLAVDDSAVGLATSVNLAVGSVHNEPGAELATQDKRVMRDRFASAGLPGPDVHHLRLNADPGKIAAMLKFPVVVKPTGLNGSRGVIRADNAAELVSAFARTRQLLLELGFGPGDEIILIESFIPGFEVAVEGLMTNGRLRVLALFDKPDPLDGPFFEETIYVTPSRLPSRVRTQIARTTKRMALAVGVRHGPVHAELRVNDEGVWPIEVAGRSIGGMCSTVLEFGSGISLEELILRHAIGLDLPESSTNDQAVGVMMIPIPGRGMFRGVRNEDVAKSVPGITGIEITAPVNAPIIPLPEGASYLGFIFARESKPADVEAALRQAHDQLDIVIEPMLTLVPT
jgi:hypothetical protein